MYSLSGELIVETPIIMIIIIIIVVMKLNMSREVLEVKEENYLKPFRSLFLSLSR